MDSLEPLELVHAAERLTELLFAHEYGRVPWLAVRLGDDEGVASTLRLTSIGAAAAVGGPNGKMAFHTEAVSAGAVRLRRRDQVESDSDLPRLLQRLAEGRHYILAVRKRSDMDAVFGERISIGRALNKDLVFRHASISKFHAYFQLDESGRCSIADAGSKNGTLVNGVKIPSREPHEIANGDTVTFGTVSTIVLDARTLWRVIHAR